MSDTSRPQLSIAGRLFQARMWREYAMAWDGRPTMTGMGRAWVEHVLMVSRSECLRRARINTYLARRLNKENSMIGKVTVTSHLPFGLNGSQPKRLCVRCTSPPEHATQTFSVVADYGWAETILCSGSYLRDANDIAVTLGEALLIPVDLATASAS